MPHSIVHTAPEKPPSYVWLPHQRAFLQSPAKYTLLIGGVRAGKSLVGARQALKWSQLYPGSKGLIGRLTAKALGETTRDTLFKNLPRGLIADWRQHEQHLWLRTPEPGVYSEILFYHLDDPGPLGSLELDWFWIDEAHEPDGSEVPEETFKILQTRLSGHVGPLRGIVTSNPGGHDWLYKYFVSGEAVAPDLRKHFAYYVARTADNLKNLPEDYGLIYAQHILPNGELDEWGKRFLDASFDVFEGQIYPDFSDRLHVRAAPPWAKNGHEIWFYAMDFGVRNATVILAGFVDYQGVLWVDDEFYMESGGEAVIPAAAEWASKRGIKSIVGDPSMFNKGADGKSVASRFGEHGVGIAPANNTVLLGIEEVRRRIRDTAPGSEDQPMLCVHPRCEHLIEQVKQYRWAPDGRGGEHDKPLKRNDHAADALRYLVMAVSAGQRGGVPKAVLQEPWNRVHPERELRRATGKSRYDRNWG